MAPAVVLALGLLFGADALRLREEGSEFLTMPLTRIHRPGFPSVYAVVVDVGHDLTQPESFLVDSGSATLTVDSLPKASSGEHHGALSLIRQTRWTIRYEATSMDGVTEHGSACIGTPPVQACSGDSFGYFQTSVSDAALTASVSGSQGQASLGGILGLAPEAAERDIAHDIERGVLNELVQSGAIKRRAFGFGSYGDDPVMHLGGWDPDRAKGAIFFELSQPSRGKWEIPVDDLLVVTPWNVGLGDLAAIQVPPGGGGSATRSMNLCPGGGCRAMVDTGTSLLEVSEEALAALQGLAPVKRDCSNIEDMPDLSVSFPGGKKFAIPARAYIGRVGGGWCQLAVNAIRKQHWADMGMDPPALVLGELFIYDHYTIFDADGGRIGLVP